MQKKFPLLFKHIFVGCLAIFEMDDLYQTTVALYSLGYCLSRDFQVKYTHCLTDVMKEPVYLGMQYPSGKADSAANCTE